MADETLEVQTWTMEALTPTARDVLEKCELAEVITAWCDDTPAERNEQAAYEIAEKVAAMLAERDLMIDNQRKEIGEYKRVMMNALVDLKGIADMAEGNVIRMRERMAGKPSVAGQVEA